MTDNWKLAFMDWNKPFVLLGAINGFLAVASGAFGAHGLKAQLTADRLSTWETAASYHLIHSVMLVLVGSFLRGTSVSKALAWSGGLFAVGIPLFSGSLYALAATGMRPLGIITPFGGVCFLAGWAMLSWWAYCETPPTVAS